MTSLLKKMVDLTHSRALSRELRTPLNAIIGFAGVDSMETERRRGYITDIRNSGAHVLALINDILDYSRQCLVNLRPTPLGLHRAEPSP